MRVDPADGRGRRRGRRGAPSTFCRSSLNGPIIAAERELGPPVGVDEARARRPRRPGRRRSARDQRVDRAGRHERVAVQQQHELAGGRADADVVRRARTRGCGRRRSARTAGQLARTAAGVPSVEALSTTTISCGDRGRRGARATPGSASRSSRVLKVTMMMVRSRHAATGAADSSASSVVARPPRATSSGRGPRRPAPSTAARAPGSSNSSRPARRRWPATSPAAT